MDSQKHIPRRSLIIRVMRHSFFVPVCVGLLLALGTGVGMKLGLGFLPAFYATLQAFATGMDVAIDPAMVQAHPYWDTLGWVIRLVAPIASATVFIRAAHVLGWLRRPLFFMHNHVIVVGAGRTGSEICRQLVEDGHDVVLIDHHHDNPHFPHLEDIGVRTLVGDGTSEATLQRAGLGRSVGLVSTVHSDVVNVDIAFRALALHPAKDHFRSFVQISDGHFRTMMGDLCATQAVQMRIFSIYALAADAVCEQYLQGPEPLELLVIAGFGRFGEAVFERFLGHPGQATCLAIDREAGRALRFEELCSAVPLNQRHGMQFSTMDMLGPRLAAAVHACKGRCVVLICTDNDVRNMDLAFSLARVAQGHENCQIVTRMFWSPEAFLNSPLRKGKLPQLGAINLHKLLRSRFAHALLDLPAPWWSPGFRK